MVKMYSLMLVISCYYSFSITFFIAYIVVADSEAVKAIVEPIGRSSSRLMYAPRGAVRIPKMLAIGSCRSALVVIATAVM